MTYKEIIYICLDLLKLSNEDSYYNESHILFLANKARNLILKQKYSDIKKQIPIANYQTICVDLQNTPVIEGIPCAGTQLKSVQKIPNIMNIGNIRIFPVNYYLGEIAYVSRDRMKYVQYSKYSGNIIYASLGTDNHIYLKSSNPQYKYLQNINITGIFDDVEQASNLDCNQSDKCDLYDKEFPLESALIPEVIQMVLQQLQPSIYRPEDTQNDAQDTLSTIQNYIQRNMKKKQY